jgi:uncharacterized membrane protein YkoI
MKTPMLALAVAGTLATLASSSGAAVAADAPGSQPVARLQEIVSHVEATYKGEVTAIQFDDSGDKPAHYHVTVRWPEKGATTLDVDAASRNISVHQARFPRGRGSVSLAEVIKFVAARVPGHLLRAELDAGAGAAPHYDVDVLLPGGNIARLKIDATTRALGWRQPAVVAAQ